MTRILGCLLGFAAAAGAQQDFSASVKSAMAVSLEKQRTSIRRQASTVIGGPAVEAGAASSATPTPPGAPTPVATANSPFYSIPWPAPPQFGSAAPGIADCDPMTAPDLEKVVKAATEREGVSAELVRLVIGKESASRPCAVSRMGAQGLMQLMPATAEELGVTDPFDPVQNVDGGTKLLKKLLTKYGGDVALALGAYNAGSGSVDRAGGIPPIPETVNYVSDILSRFRIQ